MNLALQYQCITAVTGAVDLVTDGKMIIRVSNGVPMLTNITAAGCSVTAVVAAFVACAPPDQRVAAAAHALAIFGCRPSLPPISWWNHTGGGKALAFKPPLMRPGDARQCCGWSAAHPARGAQAGGGGGGEGCQGPGQPTRRAAGSALHDGPSHSGARRASPFRQLMLNEEGGGALVVVAHLRRARLAGVAPRSRLAGPAARLRPPFVLLQGARIQRRTFTERTARHSCDRYTALSHRGLRDTQSEPGPTGRADTCMCSEHKTELLQKSGELRRHLPLSGLLALLLLDAMPSDAHLA
jgi:hypothetical protein